MTEVDKRSRWPSVCGLVFVAGYNGYGSFALAEAVGVTWLAYYWTRFTLNEPVAKPEHGIILACTLMTILAWGQFYSSVRVKELLTKIERACDSTQTFRATQVGHAEAFTKRFPPTGNRLI